MDILENSLNIENERMNLPAENEMPYLDALDTSAQDAEDMKKAQADTVTPKDRRILTVLAVLNAAVLCFIGLYFVFTGKGDEYKEIINEARFEENAEFFTHSSVFADDELTPNYVETQYPQGILPGLKALYSENSDTAAWIRINGTNVDHVVLQADDNEKYDRATFYNEYYVGGSLYMDYRNRLGNTKKGLSKNTIIYGHYLENQRGMFTDLNLYQDVEYYKEHPIIEMSTLYGNYKFKIIAAFIAADSEEKDNALFYYWDDTFSDENTLGFANECAIRSFIRTENAVDVLPTDKFLTLSTCSHTCDIDGKVNARFVIVARLVRDGESDEVDTSLVAENPQPRMPQLWYDLRGLDNPFEKVPIWQYD